MKFGLNANPRFLDHDTGTHVENAGRLRAVREALTTAGLFEHTVALESRPATDEEILLCHEPSVIADVEAASAQGGRWLDPDTYASPATAEVARLSAGTVIEAALALRRGEADRAFVCVRPPGHHATPGTPMGFCFYSNVALAAKAAGCRVFLFDWDVHHGNGTQDCLYSDGDTCFFSVHQYPFYPGTGAADERGTGAGSGLTYNLPLWAGLGDPEYLFAFDRLVAPACRKFAPELIIVSAGYDAHRGDPLGGMQVSTDGFRQLASRIAALAQEFEAPLLGVLEGGYNPRALGESVVATIEAWRSPSPVNEVTRLDDRCRRLVQRLASEFEV